MKQEELREILGCDCYDTLLETLEPYFDGVEMEIQGLKASIDLIEKYGIDRIKEKIEDLDSKIYNIDYEIDAFSYGHIVKRANDETKASEYQKERYEHEDFEGNWRAKSLWDIQREQQEKLDVLETEITEVKSLLTQILNKLD